MKPACGVRPVLLAVSLALCALNVHAAGATPGPEQQLVDALDQLRDGDAAAGMKALASLTQSQPNFRAAQLVYADLLAIRSGKPDVLRDQNDSRAQELEEETRLRLDQAKFRPLPGTVPDAILKLGSEYPFLVLVDLPRARLHLFENHEGRPKLIRSHYAAMGKAGFGKLATGDNRTPVGIYHITGWINDGALPDLYGSGALPLNYPNLWDRFRAKTGFGIWLHGVPSQTYARAPRSSEGCVTMANDDLLALKAYVAKNQAPVVLSDKVEWVSEASAAAERNTFLAAIEDWRQKWVSKDSDGYLAFYAEDFTTDGMNKTAFDEYKRRINATKKFIEVGIGDISLFRYPGEPMMLAEFTLKYKSDSYEMSAKKEQYWRKNQNGEWKIFREENR